MATSYFLEDYKPNQNLELSFDSFKLMFQCMSHLSASGPFGIVFEHLHDYFHLKDLASGFFQLFQLCFHITQGHIPPQIARVLGTAHLLTMTSLQVEFVPLHWKKHYIDSQAPLFVFNSVKLL
jgi:hypothetical protein